MIRLSDLNKKVKVISHQCIGIKVEAISIFIVQELVKEHFEASLIKKDPLSSIPSGDDMIQDFNASGK
jgi:hypothetical protein